MSLAFIIFLVAWIAGMVCTFLPAVPATLIIFAGAAIAMLLDGFQAGADLPFLLGFGLVTLLVMSVDNVASAWGAKKYGGGKEAMWGAIVGGLLGMLLGPLGLFVGTLVGILAGIGAKLVLHFVMGIYTLWRLWEPAQRVGGGG